jgi:hypothetical protein
MESRPVRPTRRSRLSSCEVTRSLSSSTTCRELMSGKSSMNNSDDVSSHCSTVIPCLRKASVTQLLVLGLARRPQGVVTRLIRLTVCHPNRVQAKCYISTPNFLENVGGLYGHVWPSFSGWRDVSS